jgi:23S rRNA pseudouridine1911/1915/1917 synthase
LAKNKIKEVAVEFLTESRVQERYAHMRIDRYLAQRFNYLSRTEWQREILKGKIYYNGAALTRNNKKINNGDVIFYTGRDAAEPEVDASYSIIYEDDYIIGINKPGNLPVHPAGVFYHNTLLTLLQKRFQMKLHLLHRLDRETSGVVVLAKNPRFACCFQKNFYSVKKVYLALVHGVPRAAEFIIDIPTGSDPSATMEHRREAHAGARDKACTRFASLFSFNGYSLIKAVPHTGRQHQIRVHLKYAGHPIVGDKLYGAGGSMYQDFIKKGFTDVMREKLKFHRSALHSRLLRFYHPAFNKIMCLKAPLPGDMLQFIDHERGADV